MRTISKNEVDKKTEQIEIESTAKSDDPHVIALAFVSGARLLYSNDRNLMDDFRNQKFIDDPPGKVYSTDVKSNPDKNFTAAHRKLLRNKDLCGTE